jgi:HAE1 family hydrophobic/amphiphilic exporter-1
MTISEVCIRRPVFTWVLVSIPVVLGIVSYGSLGVDLFPNVDFPVASVTTVLNGASVEEMETSVTKPIEDIINTISGIDELRSTTTEGVSIVTVQFQLWKDGDVGAQEVRDKVNTVLRTLPDGTESPVINRFDTSSMPVMTLAISGRRDFREVTEIARKKIKERIETVQGVGAVSLAGGRTRAMNIVVDPDKLAAFGLSVEDVRLSLLRQNLEVPGGRVDQGPRELTLRTLGRLSTAAEFNNLIVAEKNGYLVRVKDIGRAEDGFEEPRTMARLDGENAVSLVVQKQSGTNTVLVVQKILDRLEDIKPTLPPDIEIETIKDQSRFIVKSIEEVKFHLLLAAALVSATILLFIRDWRTTLIATLAIPTSIIPTFLFMSYMGFTLNNITMLGLILAIGIVIDDAVVVHENIFRHMEEDGLDAMTASRIGTREIALPVLATSLSLIVIFVPIAFMGGIIGRFFSSFGLTVAFAIAMSLFVSFTLTPMLCSRFLKLEAGHGGEAARAPKSKSGFFWRIVEGSYIQTLRLSLRLKFLVVIFTGLVIFSTVPIAKVMGLALIPRDDQSEYELSITTPEGYSLERSSKLFAELEKRLWQVPGTTHVFTSIGEVASGISIKGEGDVTRGTIYVRMKELEDREYTQDMAQAAARTMLLDYPDLRASVNDVSAFQGGRRSQTFQVNIAGPDLQALSDYSQSLKTELHGVAGMTDIDTTLSLRKPEVQVSIDRARASDLGIPVATIADSLRALVGGLAVSKFRDGDEQYDVWLRAVPQKRSRTIDLNRLTVPSPRAGLVELTSLANLSEKSGPTEIERLNRERCVTVLANTDTQTLPLGTAMTKAGTLIDNLKMPADYHYEFTGQAKTLGETGYYFMVAFLLSIVFMYMILAAQFESWLQPIAIMMALPVTIPFGLLSLVLFRTPMDIYAMFGLFMLVGIVKKNGILQVDTTNQLRHKGVAKRQAIVESNRTRLRPILMTTLMLVAAMVPIALGQGPGAGSRASMAKVIIGGQMLSLVLALVVTPVFYDLLDGLAAWSRRMGIRFSVTPDPLPPPVIPAGGGGMGREVEEPASVA